MRCLAYKLYDRFKQSRLASKLFFSGMQFQHLGPIERTGTVTRVAGAAADGDTNFDLQADQLWHCEVTPCQSPGLRDTARALKVGMVVRVTGIETFDPDHHIGPKKLKGGGNEIHPVTNIEAV